jgi:hypothetical protein
MVVAAGGEEEEVAGRAPAGHVTRFGSDLEAEDPDIEVADAVDVGSAEVDVADTNAGSIGSGAAAMGTTKPCGCGSRDVMPTA